METKQSPVCAEVEPLLSAHLLGEATDAESMLVRSHLETCAACREELELLRSTIAHLAQSTPLPADSLDDGRRTRLLQAAAGPARPGQRPAGNVERLWRFVPVTLAAAGLLGFGVWMFLAPRAPGNAPLLGGGTPVAPNVPVVAIGGDHPALPPDPPPGEPSAAGSERSLARASASLSEETVAVSSPPRPLEVAAKTPEVSSLKTLEPTPSSTRAPADELRSLELAMVDKAAAPPADSTGIVPKAAGAFPRAATDALQEGGEIGIRAEDRKSVTMADLAPYGGGGGPGASPGRAKEPLDKRGLEPHLRFRGRAEGSAPGAASGTGEKQLEEVLLREKKEAEKDLFGLAPKGDGEAGKAVRVRTVANADLPEQRFFESGPSPEKPQAPAAEGLIVAPAGATSSPASGPATTPLTASRINAAPPAAKGAVGAAGADASRPAQGDPGAPEPSPAGGRGAEARAGEQLADAGGRETEKEQVIPVGQQLVDRLSAAPAGGRPEWKSRLEDVLSRLDRRPGETPDAMLFRYWGDNPFVEASTDPLSTFGVDVDTASYSLFRSYLMKQGLLPPREAIRTEEFVNAFRGRFPAPTEEGRAFAVHTEVAPSPFAHEPDYRVLRVGIKAREVSREKRKAASLVFVIDTSGSMRRENRLELVKEALRLLVKELDEGDTIGVVAFDFEARTILDPTPASEKERIIDAIARLEPRQNTNVSAGLELGFRMAANRLLRDGVNRVLLLSDGVANTGVTDVAAMLERIRAERERGIYLTTVGVGMGNLNDALLEQLADRGNGQCVYVDRVEEARKAFVENLTGTLEVVARDVKIQVEFDPARVLRYRLLGYENRAIADQLFRDNTVDAGEVGAGHEVTALYELKLRPEASGRFATVRVRSLTVDHGEAQEVSREVDTSSIRTSLTEASPLFRVHLCAAELAEVLRESYWARGGSLERVGQLLAEVMDLRASEGGPLLGEDPDIVELLALVKRADALFRVRQSQVDDVTRTVEALKENSYLGARVEDELQRRNDANRAQLDELRRRNDDLRLQLESLLAR